MLYWFHFHSQINIKYEFIALVFHAFVFIRHFNVFGVIWRFGLILSMHTSSISIWSLCLGGLKPKAVTNSSEPLYLPPYLLYSQISRLLQITPTLLQIFNSIQLGLEVFVFPAESVSCLEDFNVVFVVFSRCYKIINFMVFK